MTGQTSSAMEVLQKLLKEEKYAKARDAIVRYLAAYRVIEGNLGLFDKLARCRDISDFMAAIYDGVRVKDRVLEKLVDGVKKNEIEVVFQYKEPEELVRVFDFGQEQLSTLLELASEDPRIVGTLIASLALAYGGIRVRG
ncbi:MAG: hypothetical protein QXZ31_11165 [Thermofilaceae archaeon]